MAPHHAHPLATLWGGGTLSSSDGQRFPQRGRSLTARAPSRYFLDDGTEVEWRYSYQVIPSGGPAADTAG